MSADGSLVDQQNQGSQGEAKLKRARRTQTSTEKAARREKRLRDRYGNSPLDPNEPPLHGLPAAAIMCALDLLRQAFRSTRGFKPKSIADKVARICSLSADQYNLLLRWLGWARARRWVLQEERRSAVVVWSTSRPDNAAVWTAALDAQWRAQIQGTATTKEAGTAPKSSSFPSSQPPETDPPRAPHLNQSGVGLPRSEPMQATGCVARASVEPPEQSDASVRSNLSPPSGDQQLLAASPPIDRKPAPAISATVSLDRGKITKFPKPAFMSGQGVANNFADAAVKFLKREVSADELRKAASSLLQDASACREFCQRSSEHRDFLESIFSQLGWEVP